MKRRMLMVAGPFVCAAYLFAVDALNTPKTSGAFHLLVGLPFGIALYSFIDALTEEKR